jgi:hypothetical protein
MPDTQPSPSSGIAEDSEHLWVVAARLRCAGGPMPEPVRLELRRLLPAGSEVWANTADPPVVAVQFPHRAPHSGQVWDEILDVLWRAWWRAGGENAVLLGIGTRAPE